MPAIDTHSSTAAVAPSSAAPPSSPTLPVSMPNTSETATIPVQSHAIALKIPLPKPVSAYSMPARQGSMPLGRNSQNFFTIFSKKFKKMLDITAHILYDRQVREWEYPAQTRAKLR